MHKEAIECFEWEMEMHPQDPLPVKWLTKLYSEMGKKEEAKNYLNLLHSMQKTSNL
ncbi:hypothetical protein [Bacillus coahuilensis]|uniref:hypothetical protein n=1 Tax=Bacillus coahuilensis TaxID=408580 RepID=UPI00187C8B5B|nr:hypothetical protein [Bacillus coahuilensis]